MIYARFINFECRNEKSSYPSPQAAQAQQESEKQHLQGK